MSNTKIYCRICQANRSAKKVGDKTWRCNMCGNTLVIEQHTKTINSLVTTSVVIPHYRQSEFLGEAVDSVLKQTFQLFEIIIVDDFSNDGSEKKVEEQAKKDSRITVIFHKENKGLSATRNTAIKAAKGKFILPLDADDTLHPDMLMKTFKCIEFMAYDIIYTDVQEFGKSERCLRAPQYDFLRLLKGNYIVSCALFFKKHWEQVGGYDESMKDGYEDWEFWIRMGEKKHYGYRLDELLFNYRIKDESMVTSTRQKHTEIVKYIKEKHPNLFEELK
jgi:glycosyltransferase involved in cell wall biosynthesis